MYKLCILLLALFFVLGGCDPKSSDSTSSKPEQVKPEADKTAAADTAVVKIKVSGMT